MATLPAGISSLVMCIVAELLKGNHIKLPEGTIGMAEDLTIGYVVDVENTQILKGSITLYDIVVLFMSYGLSVDDVPALVISD